MQNNIDRLLMKAQFCKLVTVFWLLLFTPSLSADIFFSDKHGHPSFSDIPDEHAEKIVLSVKPYRYKVFVNRVIDGDTLELKSGERVRLLSINTPEIESHFHQAQSGGEQAKTWLTKRLAGHQLYLEYDEQQLDNYDRALAHAFIDNDSYLNAELLRQGLAVLNLIPPNLRYSDLLIAAQTSAQSQQLGLWQLPEYQLRTLTYLQKIRHVKGWQRWSVKVKAVKETRKTYRLIVNDKFYIVIAKKHLHLFANLQQYVGQEVEVRGWLSRRKDQFSIRVQHPSALIRY